MHPTLEHQIYQANFNRTEKKNRQHCNHSELSTMDRSSKQETTDLNNIIDQMNLINREHSLQHQQNACSYQIYM